LHLINGLGSQCIAYDVALCEKFVENGFFVIRFDNRDVGLSSKLNDVTPRIADVGSAVRTGSVPDVPYRLSDMALDGVAVLDASGVASAHVVGMSMGGMIVQQMAIDHPERLRSLTSIMSSTGDADVGHSSPDVAELFYTPPGNDRETVIERRQALDRLCTSPSQYDADRVAQRVGDAFDRCFCPRGVARQLAAVIASGSRTPALRSVRVPALVLPGEADPLNHISGGIPPPESNPGDRCAEIRGIGHV